MWNLFIWATECHEWGEEEKLDASSRTLVAFQTDLDKPGSAIANEWMAYRHEIVWNQTIYVTLQTTHVGWNIKK